jgi:hypothetical protein
VIESTSDYWKPFYYLLDDELDVILVNAKAVRNLAGRKTDVSDAFRALPVDIVLEKDVPVTMRDGVTIYVDVLRPAGGEKVPVIVAWSPYGKGEGSAPAAMGVFGLVGLDNGIVSSLHKFEGPDPPDRHLRRQLPAAIARVRCEYAVNEYAGLPVLDGI